MMELFSLIATAVGAAIATVGTKMAGKAVEKIGEKSGEKVFSETEKFLAALRQQKPELVRKFAKSTLKPVDLGNAVVEIEAAAQGDAAIVTSAEALATAARADADPELKAMIQQVLDAVKAQPPKPENAGKRAEKIGAYAEQGDVTITTLNMD
jgi:hypothetical protein